MFGLNLMISKAFGLNAMFGWATYLSTYLPPSSSQAAHSCALGTWL